MKINITDEVHLHMSLKRGPKKKKKNLIIHILTFLFFFFFFIVDDRVVFTQKSEALLPISRFSLEHVRELQLTPLLMADEILLPKSTRR